MAPGPLVAQGSLAQGRGIQLGWGGGQPWPQLEEVKELNADWGGFDERGV